MMEQHELHDDTICLTQEHNLSECAMTPTKRHCEENLKQTQGLLFTSSMTTDIETSKKFTEVCLKTRLTRNCDDAMRGHNEMTQLNKLNVHTTKLMIKRPFAQVQVNCFTPLFQLFATKFKG